MARVADQGFSLRRPTKILPTHGPDHVEAYTDRHRLTSQRVPNVQAGRRQTTPRQPNRRKLHTLLPQPARPRGTSLVLVATVLSRQSKKTLFITSRNVATCYLIYTTKSHNNKVKYLRTVCFSQ